MGLSSKLFANGEEDPWKRLGEEIGDEFIGKGSFYNAEVRLLASTSIGWS